MARIRSIHPGMGESRDISKLSFAARYFFSLLWCHLDDEGRAEWLPKKLVGAMYCYDDDVTSATITEWRDECVKVGLLNIYEINNVTYICSPTFGVYQKPNKPQISKIPPQNEPLLEHYGSTTVAVPESLPNRVVPGVGKEKELGVGDGGGSGRKTPRTATFQKPTIQEIEEYMISRGFPNTNRNSQRFIDHYESNGWMVGKSAMKDWRATVRKWESNMRDKGEFPTTQSAEPKAWMPDTDWFDIPNEPGMYQHFKTGEKREWVA